MSICHSSSIPEAIRAYTAGLSQPARGRQHTAQAVPAFSTQSDQPTVQFVFSGLTPADLAYDSSEYPQTGTFTGVMPPWLNDLAAVPLNWQWAAEDTANAAARTTQVTAAMSYIDQNVPGQVRDNTSTASIIAGWYTHGMWSPNENVFRPEQVAALTGHWIDDDAEFCRQRLGGANPHVIKQAKTDDIGAWIGAASNGASLSALRATLTEQQAAGALFVCDYRAVLGPSVTRQYVRKGSFLAAPVGYFTVDAANNALQVQAIQIEGTDGASYIFTPNDSKDPKGDAWLLAKLWLASSDQQWWFSGAHLFNTHTIDMLFGTAALAQIQAGTLPTDSPMLALAQPFLKKSFNVNNLVIAMPGSGETGIYQKGSFCDAVLPTGRIGLYQIISNLYQGYTFEGNAFPLQMAARGLANTALDAVPFPYRDDGQSWWIAISAFVARMVDAVYANDAAVAADSGLCAWMGAVQSAFNADGAVRFTWKPTIAVLKSTFSNLLFTCSVQHTSVNNTMFNAWAFTPNGPFAMQASPPADAASVTQQTVFASLPNPQEAKARNLIKSQIAFVMNGTSGVAETLAVSANMQDMLAIYPWLAGSAEQNVVADFWRTVWTGPASVQAQVANNQAARIASWKGAGPAPNSLAYYYLSAALETWGAPQYLNAAATNAIQI